MPKKTRVRKSKRMGHRGGEIPPPSSTPSLPSPASSTLSSTPPEPTLWGKIKNKINSFGSQLMGPDAKRDTPPDTSTVGEKLDKLTSEVGNKVDEAKEKVGAITTNVSTTVSDLFNDSETNNPLHDQSGGKLRRKRRTTARSTIRSNISKKITKIVNMVKNRMTCKNKHKKSKRNYRGGSSVSYYGSYPNSVGKINVPVPPK